MSTTKTMKAVVVPVLKAKWELIDVPIPVPGTNQVLIKIHACGICGTDVWMTGGEVAFRQPPLMPGHEGVGEIVALGEGVTTRKVGDRVGICTMQHACGHCEYCNEGHPITFVTAANCAEPVLTGFNVNGGHAEYLVAYVDGTVLLPDSLPYEQAAPIMCAGYAVWSGFKRANPQPTQRIAVVGIGGLGHLALQYAKYAGFTTIAVTHTKDKEALAKQLGADIVVADGDALKKAGGADIILVTGNSSEATMDSLKGLKPEGKAVLMGISFEQFSVPILGILLQSQQIIGSSHNGLYLLTEALKIAATGKVKAMVEVFPKEKVNDAYERIASGKVRFRAVVTY